MNIVLEHPAVKLCTAWEDLLKDCQNFSTFCGRINKTSKKIAQSKQPNLFYNNAEVKKPEQLPAKFKGDVFELFCELLIRLSPIDDRVGIFDYHVVTEGDTGVDGYGKALDSGPATVQVKYRSWDYLLTADREHLDNFRETSYLKYGVDPQADGKMLILTAGQEIHWRTLDRYFQGKVRCIARNSSYGCLRGSQKKTIDSLFSISTMVNGNTSFWNSLREAVGL